MSGSKEKEPVSNGSSLSSQSKEWTTFGDAVKFPSSRIASTQRRVKKKWQSREERKRVDEEYDIVLVPSDGGVCISGSESDDSDWSIGWLEHHGADFLSDHSDNESDDSFAVLVRCYRPGSKQIVEVSNNQLFTAAKNPPNKLSPEGNNFMEQWLQSLQNF
ncbi:uncharacterized protein LOC123198482 [Mangifera indica]|uniref:uncharacterized protein LOC123198482 n=1 Tax=Mangifera indica TaxID=29780 RepID=UPI001CF9EC2C|nr:uncharacterized protein LOC123198482 [Mangifera indica]XP_044469097.1 uncharacterized protein LOC123198482 [Mangifera indica]